MTIFLSDVSFAKSANLEIEWIEDSIQEGLPYIIDQLSLAYLAGIELRILTWLLHYDTTRTPKTFVKNTLYECYKIPKPQTAEDRARGRQRYRHIQNPEPKLKFVQKSLAQNFWNLFPLPDYVTAFRKGVSIQDTAKLHAGAPLIISVDIADFFPSITEKMVRSFLEAYGYPSKIARNLSELSTYKAFLPQGSPSSPVISNLVGYHRFDKKIKDLADKHQFIYTRYADDLIFSTNSEESKDRTFVDKFYEEVCDIVESAGFKIAGRKTKFMRTNKRQEVLGSIVNPPAESEIFKNSWSPIRIPMKDYLNTRAKLHDALHNGLDAAANRHGLTAQQFLKHLEGYINSYVRKTDHKRWLKLSPILGIIKWRYRGLISNTGADGESDISISTDEGLAALEKEFAKLANS